mmetsp:Transcript_42166/g.72033  ORF Transcript_42166/g.72033 Transcript_42166/m.72033 type:complete len:161 (-) Transcript_42166:271-753(-)
MHRSTLLVAALSLGATSAFAPVAMPRVSTAVNLVPEQGRQLVAFSQDYLSKKAKQSASKASNLTSSRRRAKGVTGAARSLMTRLLGDEEKTRRDHEVNPLNERAEDEVLYPIVGFNLVDGNAIATPDQQAACELHLSNRGNQEETYGYWSTCQGGDSLWL